MTPHGADGRIRTTIAGHCRRRYGDGGQQHSTKGLRFQHGFFLFPPAEIGMMFSLTG
jgi:hypothetical protein